MAHNLSREMQMVANPGKTHARPKSLAFYEFLGIVWYVHSYPRGRTREGNGAMGRMIGIFTPGNGKSVVACSAAKRPQARCICLVKAD